MILSLLEIWFKEVFEDESYDLNMMVLIFRCIVKVLECEL